MISYNKLWKLLIDRGIKKTKLAEKCHISRKTLARMGKNTHLSTEVLEKICLELECEIGDIVEFIKDELE